MFNLNILRLLVQLVGGCLFGVDNIRPLSAFMNRAALGVFGLCIELVVEYYAVWCLVCVNDGSAIGHLLAQEGFVGLRVSEGDTPGNTAEWRK
jgi:hypothetical protein